MSLKASKKNDSVSKSVDTGRGIQDANTGMVLETANTALLTSIQVLYGGYKTIKNVTEDILSVWVYFPSDTPPTVASDFKKFTLLAGYNWEAPAYISTTEPVLTGITWSALTRPTAEQLYLIY